MTIFSRGVTATAKRDLGRILNSTSIYQQPIIAATALRLLEEVRFDPHLKGAPAPMPGYEHLHRLDRGPLRMFFWVRQPPLMDLYAEVVGFSLR